MVYNAVVTRKEIEKMQIGEFSKMALLTVKTLRFYEKEGLLIPAKIDKFTGYRFYETSQLGTAARIRALRQLDLSIEEIKNIFSGADEKAILQNKAQALKMQREGINTKLSVIKYLLEEDNMKYQVTEKTLPKMIVYYSEKRLKNVADKLTFVPKCGAEVKRLNPNLKCAVPEYEFCEYLDDEFRENDVFVRHNEAVTAFGNESENIKFRELPETKVISIFHKGAYENLGEAYAYIIKYAEENGYTITGKARESYIDGIWNKENQEDWLTEIQLPVEKN